MPQPVRHAGRAAGPFEKLPTRVPRFHPLRRLEVQCGNGHGPAWSRCCCAARALAAGAASSPARAQLSIRNTSSPSTHQPGPDAEPVALGTKLCCIGSICGARQKGSSAPGASPSRTGGPAAPAPTTAWSPGRRRRSACPSQSPRRGTSSSRSGSAAGRAPGCRTRRCCSLAAGEGSAGEQGSEGRRQAAREEVSSTDPASSASQPATGQVAAGERESRVRRRTEDVRPAEGGEHAGEDGPVVLLVLVEARAVERDELADALALRRQGQVRVRDGELGGHVEVQRRARRVCEMLVGGRYV